MDNQPNYSVEKAVKRIMDETWPRRSSPMSHLQQPLQDELMGRINAYCSSDESSHEESIDDPASSSAVTTSSSSSSSKTITKAANEFLQGLPDDMKLLPMVMEIQVSEESSNDDSSSEESSESFAYRNWRSGPDYNPPSSPQYSPTSPQYDPYDEANVDSRDDEEPDDDSKSEDEEEDRVSRKAHNMRYWDHCITFMNQLKRSRDAGTLISPASPRQLLLDATFTELEVQMALKIRCESNASDEEITHLFDAINVFYFSAKKRRRLEREQLNIPFSLQEEENKEYTQS